MAFRFRADATGKAAIYVPGNGASANDVFDDPDVDPSRVVFHSARPVLGSVREFRGSAILTYAGSTQFTIGAHGQPWHPMTIGWLGRSATATPNVPWAGSVAFLTNADEPIFVKRSWDRTNIYLEFVGSIGFGTAGLRVYYEVHVLDQEVAA